MTTNKTGQFIIKGICLLVVSIAVSICISISAGAVTYDDALEITQNNVSVNDLSNEDITEPLDFRNASVREQYSVLTKGVQWSGGDGKSEDHPGVLTLNNASINISDDKAKYALRLPKYTNIEIKGHNNRITYSYDNYLGNDSFRALWVSDTECNISISLNAGEISGSISIYSPDIELVDKAFSTYGIYINGDLTVDTGVVVNAYSGNAIGENAENSFYSDAISVYGNLNVNGSINATAGNVDGNKANSFGIQTKGDINNYGYINSTGGTADGTNCRSVGIYLKQRLINNGTIIIQPGNSNGQDNHVCAMRIICDDTASINSLNYGSLIVKSVNTSSVYFGIENSGGKFTNTIFGFIKIECGLNSGNRNAAMQIQDFVNDGNIYISSGISTNSSVYGINIIQKANDESSKFTNNGNITIDSQSSIGLRNYGLSISDTCEFYNYGNVNVASGIAQSGSSYGIRAAENTVFYNAKEGNMNVAAGDSVTDGSYGLCLTVDSQVFNAGIINARGGEKSTGNSYGFYIAKFKLFKNYGYISGTALNSLNDRSIGVYIHCDPDTLYKMENYGKIIGKAADGAESYGIYASGAEFIVNSGGEAIAIGATGSTSSYALKATNNVKVLGGTLVLYGGTTSTSDEKQAMYVDSSSSTLIIEDDVFNEGKVIADGIVKVKKVKLGTEDAPFYVQNGKDCDTQENVSISRGNHTSLEPIGYENLIIKLSKKCTFSFIAVGQAEPYKIVEVFQGDKIEMPDDPEAPGFYKFGGWYTMWGDPYNFSKIVLTDMVLYSYWANPITEAVVSFVYDSDLKPWKMAVEKYTKIESPDMNDKGNEKFGGWYTEDGAVWNFDAYIVFNDFELEAKWVDVDSDTEHVVEINFMIPNIENNSYSKPWKMTVKDGDKVNILCPVYPGHLVTGWFRDPWYIIPFFTIFDRVTEDMKLFAKWDEIYTVNFDSNGGSKVDSQFVFNGEVAQKPADPTKEGYIFDAWYVDDQCTQAWDFNNLVTGNMTLYAKWIESPTPVPVPDPPTPGGGGETDDPGISANTGDNEIPLIALLSVLAISAYGICCGRRFLNSHK